MIPEITLVAATQVGWERWVIQVNEALGRSPTHELDNCGMPVGSPGTYLASLAEFNRRGSNPVTACKDADRVLSHLGFSFLVACDRDMALAILKQSVGLFILDAEPSRGRENFLISGNLRDWRSCVVECCKPDVPPEARAFYNAVWVALDRLGFRDIFATHIRKDLKDHTFILEQKRNRL